VDGDGIETMEDLRCELEEGLSADWTTSTECPSLPPQTTIALCATDGVRKLAFLHVDGEIRSSLPYFDANSRFRAWGIETVWLFKNGSGFPSTRHMLCTSLEWLEGIPVVRIVNIGNGERENMHRVKLSTLARAAVDKRLKVANLAVGQRVGVSLTSDRTVCGQCGASDYRIDHATIQLVDDPSVPSLALSRNNLGKCVSRLMIEGLFSQAPRARAIQRNAGGRCQSCDEWIYSSGNSNSSKLSAEGSIVLSNVAALELLRHYQTAWYIALDR
jgi:hypothetical protein